MRGVLITARNEIRPPQLSSKISTFAHFFHPILPQLRTVHWLYHSWPFEKGDEDEEFCRRVAQLVHPGGYRDNYGYIPPGLLIPDFSNYVTDDWASLYGFYNRPDDVAFFTEHDREKDRVSQLMRLDETVDLCFFNVDAAFWDFYARDESLLEKIRSHAATLEHVRIEDRDLLQIEY